MIAVVVFDLCVQMLIALAGYLIRLQRVWRHPLRAGPRSLAGIKSTTTQAFPGAQMCVLDDISRAPGEALNVLLRVLNERKWGNGVRAVAWEERWPYLIAHSGSGVARYRRGDPIATAHRHCHWYVVRY